MSITRQAGAEEDDVDNNNTQKAWVLREISLRQNDDPGPPCLHDLCSRCNGSGQIKDGSGIIGPCVHMISCPCKRCSPSY